MQIFIQKLAQFENYPYLLHQMELVYIYSIMSLLALVGIIWLQIKMRKDKRGIL